MSTPYLCPIERPHSLLLKIVYLVSRRQFGKVPTPIAVYSSRMPPAFLTFVSKISRLDKKLALPERTAVIIRQHVAGLNGCLFCMDLQRWYITKKLPDDVRRIAALAEYQTSSLFSDTERAALDYASELVTSKHVAPDTFARLARHYSEREICDIIWLVASEHVYNITNQALNIGSDGYCELSSPATAAMSNAA
jgi:alkylhydroperoxidase family enzyme